MLLALLVLTTSPAWAEPPEPTTEAQPPSSTTAPEELPIIAMPSILEYVEAAYPEEAKNAGIEATVTLLLEINETGQLLNAEVSIPAGHGFDEAALEAVRQMKFSPALTEAGPIPVAFEFNYGFFLKTEAIVNDIPTPVESIPAPINLDGTVREMGTRRRLERARIVVLGPSGFEATAETDSEGKFALRGVPLGSISIRVVDTGHVPLEKTVDVVEGQVTSLNLWIRADTYRENEVIAVYRKEEQEVTRRTLSIDEIRQIPGTFGDPVKVVQTLPGAARSPFGTGFLIIRGSNPEDSGVYVDGVRIPLIYHLTGTTSVLSPELIEAVDYLPGGYGVQYGRSMGGVVDIRTKSSFEKNKIVWGTDILDSQLYFEGNLGKKKQHGLAIGARRSYIDAFIPLFTGDDFNIKPVYWDYQLKWVPPSPADGKTSVFVYGFNDLLTVSTPEDRAQGPDQDTQGDFLTEYSSHRLVAQVDRLIAPHLRFTLTPSVGVDSTRFGIGNSFTLATTNLTAEIRAELPWTPHPAFELVPGLDFIGGWWKFNLESPLRISEFGDPLAEREPISFGGTGTGWAPDLYVKANIRPLHDRSRWLITPGLRASSLILTTKGTITGGKKEKPYGIYAFDPRLLTRFAINKRIWLKASTGLYQQPPQPSELLGIGTRVSTTFEHAFASSLGIEHQVTDAISWDAEVFYKDMNDLITFNEDWTGFGDQAYKNQGDGRAYGVELILRHAKTGKFFGWISYTFSRSFRRDAPEEAWAPFDYDQPHIFSAQGGYELPFDISVSAQVQVVSGNPHTPFNAGVYDVDSDSYTPFTIGPRNSERLPPFFQSSIRVDKLWTFKRWQLTTYVDLLNVVRGVNPEFTVYDYDYSDYTYIRGLPFIPNIGIEAKFWL